MCIGVFVQKLSILLSLIIGVLANGFEGGGDGSLGKLNQGETTEISLYVDNVV